MIRVLFINAGDTASDIRKAFYCEQYFGLSHLHDNAFRARFSWMIKNLIDVICRQMTFNLFPGANILRTPSRL